MKFDDLGLYERFLSSQFQRAGFSAELSKQAASILAASEGNMNQPTHPRGSALRLIVRGYVVHTDDLKLFQTFLSAVASLISAEVGSEAGVAIGIIVAGCGVAYQLKQKGATVDPLQARLLTLMKRRGPLTLEQIAVALNMHPAFKGAEGGSWSAEQVEDQLSNLTKIRLRDGTITAFVSVDADGRWGTVDV